MNRFSVLLLAALASACSSGGLPPIQPPQPPPTQTFAVVVKDFVTPDLPVEGVQVNCNAPGVVGLTNADGYIAFEALSNQTYDCTLTKEGYDPNAASHFATPEDPTLNTWIRRTPPPYQPGLQGTLRIADGCFRDDTGCVNPIYAHAGDAFSRYTRDPDYVRSQLDLVAQQGYQGVRIWAVLGGPYWAGREVGPGVTSDYWGHVDRFLSELRSRNLRAVWSMGDIGQLRGTRADYMASLANVNAVHGAIDFLDCGNEAWQTGEPNPDALSECVGFYRGTALRTLTSPPGEETHELNAYSIGNADLYDVHGSRDGHFWDKLRHMFSIPYEGKPNKAFGIQSEPWGSGGLVSVTANKSEINDEMSALGAVMSAISRQAWVWFSGEGVVLQKGLETEAGFFTNPRALALLPKDLATYERLHHSGASQSDVRTFAVPSDSVRIDGRTASDGRTVQVIYGPPGTYRVPVVRDFRGRICNPETADCVEVALAKGSTFEVSFNRGRIIIGQSR